MNVKASTIAVIDDDSRVLESLVNLLRSFGYSAESYKSAEQFLESGTLSRISCIVTDVEMRQMSGLGLLQYLKKRQTAEQTTSSQRPEWIYRTNDHAPIPAGESRSGA